MATVPYGRASHPASLRDQVRRLTEHAQAHGWPRREEFTDCASGTDKSRTGWQALCQAVAEGRVRTILWVPPDRLTRVDEEVRSVLAGWEDAGVRVVTLDWFPG